MLLPSPRPLGRVLPAGRLRRSLPVVLTIWMLLLVAGCQSSAEPGAAAPAPSAGTPRVVVDDGFEAQEGRGGDAGWWLSSANGTLLVHGRPMSTAFVTLTLSPSPCGPARLRVAEQDVDLPASFSVSLGVDIAASGQGQVSLFSYTSGCHVGRDPRALYAFVSHAQAAATPTTSGARPADGFGGPERTATSTGFWLISVAGRIIAYGPPSTPVLVSMQLAPPPCGAARVQVAGRTHGVSRLTRITVRLVLDRDGTADIPVLSLRPDACELTGDPRELRLLVSDVSARRA